MITEYLVQQQESLDNEVVIDQVSVHQNILRNVKLNM